VVPLRGRISTASRLFIDPLKASQDLRSAGRKRRSSLEISLRLSVWNHHRTTAIRDLTLLPLLGRSAPSPDVADPEAAACTAAKWLSKWSTHENGALRPH